MATWMLVNLVKERVINVPPLHGVVGHDKKMLVSAFKSREERE